VFEETLQLAQAATAMIFSIGWFQLARVKDENLRIPSVSAKCNLYDVTPVSAIGPYFPLSVQPDDCLFNACIDFFHHRIACSINTPACHPVKHLNVIRQLLKRERSWNLYISRDVRETSLKHWAVIDLVGEHTLRRHKNLG
jgi:hypothetical protein